MCCLLLQGSPHDPRASYGQLGSTIQYLLLLPPCLTSFSTHSCALGMKPAHKALVDKLGYRLFSDELKQKQKETNICKLIM